MSDNPGKKFVSEIISVGGTVAKKLAGEPSQIAASAMGQITGTQKIITAEDVAKQEQEDQRKMADVKNRLAQLQARQQRTTQEQTMKQEQKKQQAARMSELQGEKNKINTPAVLAQKNTAERKRTGGG